MTLQLERKEDVKFRRDEKYKIGINQSMKRTA